MAKKEKKSNRGGGATESIDDRLENQRHHQASADPVPGAPLPRQLPGEDADESLLDEPAPRSAVAGSPDPISRSEQSPDTTEKDSPERAFGAMKVPANADERISKIGIPLETEEDDDDFEDEEEDDDDDDAEDDDDLLLGDEFEDDLGLDEDDEFGYDEEDEDFEDDDDDDDDDEEYDDDDDE